jgi:hypothetical protein
MGSLEPTTRHMVDVDEDETAVRFFSSHPPDAREPDEELVVDPRRSLVSPARRTRNLRIVKASVLVCAVLCLAASLRVVSARAHDEVRSQLPAMVQVEAPAPAPAPVPVATRPAEPAPLVAEVAPAPTVDPRWPDARAARRAAVVALEARRVDEAVAAATAATVLDATDGEAWLLLGAAFQDRGKLSDAIDAYRKCRLHGRSDPRGECGAMLSSLGAR